MATTEQRAAAWTAFRDEESKNVRWGLLCNLHSAKIETTDRKMQTAFGQLLWHLMDKLDNVDWLDEGTPPQQLYDFLLRRPDVEITQTELTDILYLISLVAGPFNLCHILKCTGVDLTRTKRPPSSAK